MSGGPFSEDSNENHTHEYTQVYKHEIDAMSSGFVSGGTTDAPIERSDEWIAAQTELEANRAKKAAEARQPEGRSLYETLEANKGISNHTYALRYTAF